MVSNGLILANLFCVILQSTLKLKKVYVLTVADTSGSKHAICLDARVSPVLIYDDAESKAIKFTQPDVLNICCPSPNKDEYAHFQDLRTVNPLWPTTASRARPGTLEHANSKRKRKRGGRRAKRRKSEQKAVARDATVQEEDAAPDAMAIEVTAPDKEVTNAEVVG